jgi:transposase InsO family protein
MNHRYKMKDLYSVAGISKQALWKYNERQAKVKGITEDIVKIMKDIRGRHKRMGCRSMYYASQQPIPVGRDIFEKIGFANGFKLHYKPNKLKTTWSQRVTIYPNLIEGKVLTGINQVWQSDIFYIPVEDKVYYGVTIEDVYSRRLLALHLAKDLRATQVERALHKALLVRKGQDLRDCIFHSDRGSQYISDQVTRLLHDQDMRISMCKLPQENSYVERIQGTLKYQYLFEANLTEKNLGRETIKTMRYYNFERPHTGLNNLPPAKFEEMVENLTELERPKLQIYKWSVGFLTNPEVIDKKEKRSKKEKRQQTTIVFDT